MTNTSNPIQPPPGGRDAALGVADLAKLVQDSVSERLQSFVQQQHSDSASWGEDAEHFINSAHTAITGGKHFRAQLAAAGWLAISNEPQPRFHLPFELTTLCAALEVFQAAALVHDDLIDNSDIRRGRPAAHRAFEQSHRAAGWEGPASDYGRSAAILLGDLLVAWSDDLLEEGLVTADNHRAVRAEYARMRREVTVGQYLDIVEESAWSTTDGTDHISRALRVANLKSARYSIEQPLVLGAVLAGATPGQITSLREFGNPLGIAFQLRDDLLGVFGDPEATGKPAGDDLREGKRTVLIALARAALDNTDRTVLDQALGNPDLSTEQITQIRRLIQQSGAADQVEDLIDDRLAASQRALENAQLSSAAMPLLHGLSQLVSHRSA